MDEHPIDFSLLTRDDDEYEWFTGASSPLPSPVNLDDLELVPCGNENEWRDALNGLFPDEDGGLAWAPAPDDPLPDRNQQLGQGNDDPGLIHVVRQSSTRQRSAFNGRFTEHSTDYTINHHLNNITDIYSVASTIDKFIHDLVSPVIAQANDTDFVSLQIIHEDLQKPIFVSYHRKNNFNEQAFLNSVFKLVQSGTSRFLLNGQLTLRVSILKSFSGNGRPKPKVAVEVEKYFGGKYDVVNITNNDIHCGYLAITLGFLFANNYPMERNLWRSLTRPRSQHLVREMYQLFQQIGYHITQPFDILLAHAIQEKLPDHQLIVIQRPTPIQTLRRADKPLFKGPSREKRIIIEYVGEPEPHYNMVKKMTGYQNVSCWCYECWCAVKKEHVCRNSCPLCKSPSLCMPDTETTCASCNISFPNSSCYNNHLQRSLCLKQLKCQTCEVVYLAERNGQQIHHVCDTSICPACNEEYQLNPHYCFIKPLKLRSLTDQDKGLKVYIAFDIEAQLLEISQDSHDHRANLLISHTVCDKCMVYDRQKSDECSICGILEHVYFGDNCVKQFVSHIMEGIQKDLHRKGVKRIVVFSHNFAGYDGRFILEEVYKRKFVGIDPVFNGTKILKLDIGLVRFIDSLSFLPLKLSELPKAFPVCYKQLRKGTFPHLFNKPENYDYVGCMPAIEYFNPDCLKAKEKSELISWYSEQTNRIFNFREEFISYCRMDVMILLNAVILFQKLFMGITKIDPYTRCFTMASSALELFRAHFLQEHTIGITPVEGYLSNKRTGSIVSHAWLDEIERIQGIKIYREKKIGNYYADGYDPITNTVYEFFGCMFHGCARCFPNRQELSPIRHTTYHDLLQETTVKLDYYGRRQFNISFVWEHELIESEYLRKRKIQLALVKEKFKNGIRSSLCGGRTENFKVLYECREDEELRFVDFVSLYPFVLKNRRFPIGHPDVITEDLEVDSYPDKGYFGFVYCKRPSSRH